jgi:quercetin dioxygenase-like cupin family protein
MILSSKDFSRSVLRSCLFAAGVGSIGACATAQQPPATAVPPSEIRVMSSSLGTNPAAGAVTRTTVYESPRTVTQVLRLAPGARIAEHHHPAYDETFLVQQGHLALSLNGKSYDLGAGDFVVMPAGTVISGSNTGAQEARVVVAFSNTGLSGPLSVAGSPRH